MHMFKSFSFVALQTLVVRQRFSLLGGRQIAIPTMQCLSKKRNACLKESQTVKFVGYRTAQHSPMMQLLSPCGRAAYSSKV